MSRRVGGETVDRLPQTLLRLLNVSEFAQDQTKRIVRVGASGLTPDRVAIAGDSFLASAQLLQRVNPVRGVGARG